MTYKVKGNKMNHGGSKKRHPKSSLSMKGRSGKENPSHYEDDEIMPNGKRYYSNGTDWKLSEGVN